MGTSRGLTQRERQDVMYLQCLTDPSNGRERPEQAGWAFRVQGLEESLVPIRFLLYAHRWIMLWWYIHAYLCVKTTFPRS